MVPVFKDLSAEWAGLNGRYGELRDHFELERKKDLLEELNRKSADPSFWEDGGNAKGILRQISNLQEEIKQDRLICKNIEEVEVLLQLVEEGGEAEEIEELLVEAEKQMVALKKTLDGLEIKLLFSAPYDDRKAMLSIHPGAGGTESQDWAEMLMRMYMRWAEKKGMEVEMLDLLTGEEAGIKSVTLSIDGNYAYGLLQSEKGVHRMVRISPFDAARRRHTSFASVDVIPEVEGEEFAIASEELRVDTFRARGAGGQHVNTTDSAVRMTHLPTGIVAQCQSDRSQHSNRQQAMRILQARLAEFYRQQQSEELEAIRGEQKSIAWGNQIRSYVFHPFTLVKDHRTDTEIGNIGEVMDGEIDLLQERYLRWKAGSKS
ncbi:MAG: peptide chain release factor 2 [Firmicutes bacterium]|nr:peptide chain release factor 2 [Bacillota bacterium]